MTGPVVNSVCVRYATAGVNSVCYSLYTSPSGCGAAGGGGPALDLCGAVWVDHDVGPLPLTTEVVTRFTSANASGGPATLYYQDSGWEAHPWVYNASLTIPGNYKALIHSGFVRSAPGSTPTPTEVALVTSYRWVALGRGGAPSIATSVPPPPPPPRTPAAWALSAPSVGRWR